MGQLARRLAEVMERHGQDPKAWQAQLQALDALEGQDAAEAARQYQAWKARLAREHRARLLAELRRHPFIGGLPPVDVPGFLPGELEADIAAGERALRHARAIEASIEEARVHRASLRLRMAPVGAPLAKTPWRDLAALAERVEAERRRAAGEARVEARIADVARRARRLEARAFEVPDLSSAAVPDAGAADRLLEGIEARLRVHEALEEAWRRARASLRDADVRAWRRETSRTIERAVEEARRTGAPEEAAARLQALAAEGATLRVEAAKAANEAARARRSGRQGPARERARWDAQDGYG